MYLILDILFTLFHWVLIGFNLSGWIWKKTRRLHFISISLTLLSWVGLGLFYGWGYCPCTDWHWQVKLKLGETGLPASYIKYYADLVTGMNWDPAVVDTLTASLGITAFLISATLNLRSITRKPEQPPAK